jgi:mycothiol synthase
MKLSKRAYFPEDYGKIRKFLSKTLLKNGFIQRCWHVSRWDYWRWHVLENITHAKIEDVVRVWVTAEGEIGAVLHPEGSGEAFFDIWPEYQSSEIIGEMIDEAENTLFDKTSSGKKILTIWAINEDPIREEVLNGRGYSRGSNAEYMRWRDLSNQIPTFQIAKGYCIRNLGNESVLPSRSWASWRAFHPDEPESEYKGWEWYLNIQRADGYQQDLDLVAVSDEGTIAGFCTVWYDPLSKTGMFEPVGVVPEHKQRGLGKAMMIEGLNKLVQIGAKRAYVGSYSPIAHALYESAGFNNFDLSVPWIKEY